MDKMVGLKFKGRNLTLNYSIEVMFDMAEKYGAIQNVLEIMGQETRESFEVIKWFLVRMANDGELVRRSGGYDPGVFLSEDDVTTQMGLHEYAEIKNAVLAAITLAYNREIEAENEEVDVGLQELNEKKTDALN